MLGMGEMVSWKSVAYLLKPNTASMGYALFLAINAAGVWGGVFPFLPMDFRITVTKMLPIWNGM